ncbi:uracil phosphoribosyltransferase-domain-containing protein [Xylariaceae sp. FL0594]|nr:uracil phosphoribosyltransferase-domain-containing protein [Xylariaceae sp. FL0594]
MSVVQARVMLHAWHKILGLQRVTALQWHKDRLRDETAEYEEAIGLMDRLSEKSDIFFAISRAQYDGHYVGPLPPFTMGHVPVYGYMLAKYTSRCMFYRTLAYICGADHTVREVVNPTKDSKLEEIAARHRIDRDKFKRQAMDDPSRPQVVTTDLLAQHRPSLQERPIVIGIYGLPGSGKSRLLERLKREVGDAKFSYYEGSQVIASLLPGGLDEFRGLSVEDKVRFRESAIEKIRQECALNHMTGVVTGHFSFWPEGGERETVYTVRDFEIYTHIIYLDVNEGEIEKRRRNDTRRERPPVTKDHIRKWQEAEKEGLRRLCYQHGVLFGVLPDNWSYADKAAAYLREFADHSEEKNLLWVEDKLGQALGGRRLETVLVLDADKTLAAEDATGMFLSSDSHDPLTELFSSGMKYSYAAFQQEVLLFEEACDELPGEHLFARACDQTAEKVKVHAELVQLLQLVKEIDHVGAIVVTCGLGLLWEKVLKAAGLSDAVQVIGNGRIADGPIITPEVKGRIVSWLQAKSMRVIAFGDSPLDMPMLAEADEAIVVVGDDSTRSRTMNDELVNVMAGSSRYGGKFDNKPFSQVLLPDHVSPRLPERVLPIIQLQDRAVLYSMLRRRNGPNVDSQIIHATERGASRLLTTPTRDATMTGYELRKAHRVVGWYLATEFLPQLVGLEEVEIPHVQGRKTVGHVLRHESKTCIVALMRGGEPMASGVSKALPTAMFVHANDPHDVTADHLDGQEVLILVDSVVNSGKTVVQFVRHIRSISANVLIIVIAGVVQRQCTSKGQLADILLRDYNLFLLALRLSQNKFTGKGTTDTGNRLFNTTSLS